MIKKVIIHNYKGFSDFSLELDSNLNIVVGDNETGKSTLLEAIGLALTKKLNGKYIENELSPYLFNIGVAKTFLEKIQAGENVALPEIHIELYFEDKPDLATFKGTNNSLKEDCVGIRLSITFDEDYKSEYEKLIDDKDQVKLIPIEYYRVSWKSFANQTLTKRGIPIESSYIDATSIRLQSGTDYYLQNIINEGLDLKERVALAVEYRKLREKFSKQDSISTINQNLDSRKGAITDKRLEIAIDVSQKSRWETNLIPHLDELPFQFSGMGEQNSLKIMLALERNADDTNVILIEEPENHLSFSSMNKLLGKIKDKCEGKQIIIATHSSFVLNKLGLDKLILMANGEYARLDNLTKDTQNYFMKLSGYDTLRLILAKKAILVEGPSDELIVQKAYLLKHGNLPIEDEIDVINVRGLSFKRFLEIAEALKINVAVVTDNDGDYQTKIEEKYKKYKKSFYIKIFADSDTSSETLESQIIKYNNLDILNKIFETSHSDENSLEKYMKNNKTECALKLFETDQKFTIPEYVKKATE